MERNFPPSKSSSLNTKADKALLPLEKKNSPEKIPHQENSLNNNLEKADILIQKKLLEFVNALKNIQKLIKFSAGYHIGIKCESCHKRDFKGFRYKCLHCNNYDLCDMCFEKKKTSENHSVFHPMLLIQDPDIGTKLELLVVAGLDTINKTCIDNKIVHSDEKCNACELEQILSNVILVSALIYVIHAIKKRNNLKNI